MMADGSLATDDDFGVNRDVFASTVNRRNVGLMLDSFHAGTLAYRAELIDMSNILPLSRRATSVAGSGF
jgi:hypothetical protein